LLLTEVGRGQEPVLPDSNGQEPIAAANDYGPKADGAKAKEDKPKAEECPNPWKTIPPVRLFPKLGDAPVPPKGPGYYSALDWLRDDYREKAPRFPYSPIAAMVPSFFDADFRYLDDPKNEQHHPFDIWHRCHLGCDWLFKTGGEVRWRHMHEVNSRLTGITNDYDLLRTRVYGDLWYWDQFRVYVEYLDAHSFNQNLPPLGIDIDRSDLLNLFADVKIAEIDDKPVYVRGGRQEILLGSQRSVSPLDWANTRRTFNGVRAFRQGDKFDLDAFWVQPVVPNASRFDSVDNDQNFAGLWATYRDKPGRFFDLYYLWLDNVTPTAQLGLPGTPFNVHTLGTRHVGDKDNFLWDVELQFQLGSNGPLDTIAGATTVGGGYHFEDLPLNPTFWVYYDYASGDQNPGAGDNFTTFNQLFPFGHYYLGWLDLVGRQNIHDVNAHLLLYPTNWMFLWLQYHHFTLASDRDALYSAGGAALRRDPTGRAGHNVGDELDLILNFHLATNLDVMVGYSHLFAGRFIEETAPNASARQSPELFFVKCSFRW